MLFKNRGQFNIRAACHCNIIINQERGNNNHTFPTLSRFSQWCVGDCCHYGSVDVHCNIPKVLFSDLLAIVDTIVMFKKQLNVLESFFNGVLAIVVAIVV